MSIKYFEALDSTNEYIKRNSANMSDFDAVYTLCQTNGRGRMGRVWESGGGIACSVYVNETENPLLLPICAAVALFNVLSSCGISDLGIKWPNDIVIDGKKLCGILCEGIGRGYIIGIGINNCQTKEAFDKAGLPYATSVKMQGYEPLCEKNVVETLVYELEKCLNMPSARLMALYSSLCINLGKSVKITENGTEYQAKAISISSNGGLVIEKDGAEKTVISGEVSVRGIYGYAD